jgi:hypothetical protein
VIINTKTDSFVFASVVYFYVSCFIRPVLSRCCLYSCYVIGHWKLSLGSKEIKN